MKISKNTQTATLNVGLLGFGTVGSGVFQVWAHNYVEVYRRTGIDICISQVSSLNIERVQIILKEALKKYPCVSGCKVSDALSVVDDPSIDVVIELIGGCDVAYDLVLRAISAGKHVVTANKALLALHGAKIFAAAQKKGVIVAFEAAVAGGIPIIKTLRESLAGDRITSITGIVNGTTNFILSEMYERGLNFECSLKNAQSLGYAEANPEFDIEGIDAAHKLTLMSAFAFGINFQFDKIYTEGIANLNSIDIGYAAQLGYRIKLLAISKRHAQNQKYKDIKVDDCIEMRVHPCLLPSKTLISSVEGVMNAIQIQSEALGATLYYGAGAGGKPTASAVMADLIDIARHANISSPFINCQSDSIARERILSISEIFTSYYLRIRVTDKTGVLSKVTSLLADANISIDTILQPHAIKSNQIDIVIITHECKESCLLDAIETIQRIGAVLEPIIFIRKESLD